LGLDFLGIGYAHNFWHRLIWTGDAYAPDNVYYAALDASADHLRKCSPIRGFYLGSGIGKKFAKGTNAPGWNVGVTGVWTIEQGSQASIDLGIGMQMRGRNSKGQYTSQVAGVGGQLYFYKEEMRGFVNPFAQMPEFGGYGGSTQNGKRNKGGSNMAIPLDGTIQFGINYGVIFGGVVLDLNKLFKNTLTLINGENPCGCD